jgi:hypothetical protein
VKRAALLLAAVALLLGLGGGLASPAFADSFVGPIYHDCNYGNGDINHFAT